MPEAWFCRGDLDDGTVRIAKVDRMEVVSVVGSRNVDAVISQSPLPHQETISVRNVQGEMMVRSSTPAAFGIANARVGHSITGSLLLDEASVRHHIEDRVPFDVGDRFAARGFPIEGLEPERYDWQASVMVMYRPLDDRQTENSAIEILRALDVGRNESLAANASDYHLVHVPPLRFIVSSRPSTARLTGP